MCHEISLGDIISGDSHVSLHVAFSVLRSFLRFHIKIFHFIFISAIPWSPPRFLVRAKQGGPKKCQNPQKIACGAERSETRRDPRNSTDHLNFMFGTETHC